LLATRGASVVANDLGGSMAGVGADTGPADAVVAEIVEAGGVAAADHNDVSTTEGAEALVATAVDTYGRIDVLINNAGIMRWGSVPDVVAGDLDEHLAVHVVGSFNTVRAAWPHMLDRGYGRLVMTTSAGLFGLRNNTSYAAAKGGVIGLTRSLAAAGAAHGIKVNALAPAAWTRMAGKSGEGGAPSDRNEMELTMAPDLVAPMAAFLAHESCPVSGEIYTAGAGRFARLFIASTEGYVQTAPAPTIEDVAANWDAINDETEYYVPTDLEDWSAAFTAHLLPGGDEDRTAPG
jgi:NAD(P)-dependent dehydrogenase (short-subunit alcohol dehydrogenase family)